MLAPDDQAVAVRDRAVPGLGLVLDPAALEALLSDFLPATGSVRVDYLRYKPGTSLTAGLELDTGIGPVRAFAVAGSAEFSAKMAGLARGSRAGLHNPLAVDPAHLVVVAPMGADPKVGALGRDLRGIRRTLPRSLAEQSVEILRYRPMRRAVGLVGPRGAPAAVVRAVEPRTMEAHLRRRRAAAEAGVALPRELVHSRRRGVLVTQYVPGLASADGTVDPEMLECAAGLLAQLHRRRPGDRVPGPLDAATMWAAARAAGVLVPAGAGAASRTAEALTGWLAAQPGPPSLVHGDFSADQLVRSPGGGVLIDLDRVRGDAPEWDIASWFAAQVLGGHVAVDADPEATLASLLSAYRAAGGPDLRRHLRGYVAAALLLRATEPFRLRRPGWAQLTRDLIGAAARLAAVPA